MMELQDNGERRGDGDVGDVADVGKVAFSFVVPVRDECAALGELHGLISAAAERLGERCEIIYVDDGSRDGTGEAVGELIPNDDRVRLVGLSRSFGRSAAAAAGRSRAAGRAVICLEGDRSGLGEVVGGLAARWREGHEVVSAISPPWRDSCAGRRTVRGLLCWWTATTAAAVPQRRPDIYLLDRKVVAALDAAADQGTPIRGPVTEIGFRQATVPWSAPMPPRPGGSLKQLIQFAAGDGGGLGLLAIRLLAGLGAVWIVLSLLLLVLGAGWLAAIMHVMLGVQMILVAAGAEYIVARSAAISDGPLYVVRETCGFDQEQPEEPPQKNRPPKEDRDDILIYT